ncbi:uncharacterized protein LOC108673955 [Hyalella azteca]|uniref:Uncharacterized protein LOC108673955 n=1 Tax=Hyalella azteca TaxID=294128 RepID=A0A8B7NUE3_HYAAZ|nr:uncharacterized protein LOC108673955 [Hyalella azteca]
MEYFSRSDATEQLEVEPSQDSDVETASSHQKANILRWKIVCLVLAVLVTAGWIGIIAVLILKEEWQLVLVAWLLLYSAVHFCYWYCRRHSSRTLTAQIRDHLTSRNPGATDSSPAGDCPPSYDDLVKCETPPPTYTSVVLETPQLKRSMLHGASSLPWFLKRKLLNLSSVAASEGKSSSNTEISEPSTSGSEEKAADTVSVSSVSSVAIAIEDNEEVTAAVELPSYEALMRGAVFTPIHQALAKLPSLPPPYSPRALQTIAEVQQQQNE